MDKSYNIFKIKTLLLFIILIYVSLNLIFLSEEYLEDGQLIVIEVTLLFLLIVKWILNKWLTNLGNSLALVAIIQYVQTLQLSLQLSYLYNLKLY